jgi:ribosomal protein S6
MRPATNAMMRKKEMRPMSKASGRSCSSQPRRAGTARRSGARCFYLFLLGSSIFWILRISSLNSQKRTQHLRAPPRRTLCISPHPIRLCAAPPHLHIAAPTPKKPRRRGKTPGLRCLFSPLVVRSKRASSSFFLPPPPLRAAKPLSTMPCYQLVVLAKPEIPPERLAELFRSLARLVYREQGQFRHLENFGVRPLAFPIRSAGAKFEEVRWVQAVYDCAPPSLPAIASLLSSDKDILQFKHLRHRDILGEFRATARGERRKRFAGAVRFQRELFDPETLELGPKVAVPGSGAMGAGAAAAAAAGAEGGAGAKRGGEPELR